MWVSTKIVAATICLLVVSTVVLSEDFLKQVLNDNPQVDQQVVAQKVVTPEPELIDKKQVEITASEPTEEFDGPIEEPVPTNSHINIFEHHPRTPMVAKIENALTSRFDFDLPAGKTSNIKGYIEKYFKIPVHFDKDVLEEEGLLLEDPIPAFKRNGLTLYDALHFLLKDLGMNHVIKHSTLVITTQTAADSFLEMRFYDIKPIMNDSEIMMELIRYSVEPDTWAENGGEGDMTPVGHTLVIRATQDVHRVISRFFVGFHNHLKKTQNGRPYDFYEDETPQNYQFEYEPDGFSK